MFVKYEGICIEEMEQRNSQSGQMKKKKKKTYRRNHRKFAVGIIGVFVWKCMRIEVRSEWEI